LFALLMLLPIVVEAAMVPALRGYVNDYGDMISPSVEADLAGKLKTFEETDSTQLVVLTVPSLEGDPVEDYSIRVAEAWKIGQKGKDNGILFLVSRDDRKMRIEVGRGLEGKLTDLTAGRIIDLVVKPKFKAEDYNGGFTAGISALIDATRGEFTADRRAPSGGLEPYAPSAGDSLQCCSFCSNWFFLCSLLPWREAVPAADEGFEGAEPGEAIFLFPGVLVKAAGPPAAGETPALTQAVDSPGVGVTLVEAGLRGAGNGRAIHGRTVFYRSRKRETPGGGA